MMIRKRVGSVALAMLGVALIARLPVAAQEPATKGVAPSPAAKKKNDPARRVPPYFGQIGLTTEQRAGIYTLQAKHQDKIDALEKQIAAEKAEMLTGCEGLLTDTQKKLLANLRQAAAEGTARPAAGSAPVKPD